MLHGMAGMTRGGSAIPQSRSAFLSSPQTAEPRGSPWSVSEHTLQLLINREVAGRLQRNYHSPAFGWYRQVDFRSPWRDYVIEAAVALVPVRPATITASTTIFPLRRKAFHHHHLVARLDQTP